MARTTATTMTATASSTILRPDARMLHGRSASPPALLANARNSAVLAEPSVVSVSRSDMAMTLAHSKHAKRPVSEMRTKPAPPRPSHLPSIGPGGRSPEGAGEHGGEHGVRPVQEPGQHDHAARAHHEWLSPDPLHHLLEMVHVRRPDVQQRIGVAGDRACLSDLGVLADGSGNVGRRGPAPAEQLHAGFRSE